MLATKVRSKMGEGPNDEGASRYHIVRWARGQPAPPTDRSYRPLPDPPLGRARHRSTSRCGRSTTWCDRARSRYVGASNFAAWQLARANLLAEVRSWSPFVTVQPHYHMLERGIEQELIPYCNAYKVGILPYFPLAGGFLTGKYRRGEAIPAGSRAERSP